MAPAGQTPPDAYKESDDHVPNPNHVTGTLDTSATAGKADSDPNLVSPVFEIAKENAKDSPTIKEEPVAPLITTAQTPEPTLGEAPIPKGTTETEASSGQADGHQISSTLDTSGTTGGSAARAPIVVGNQDVANAANEQIRKDGGTLREAIPVEGGEAKTGKSAKGGNGGGEFTVGESDPGDFTVEQVKDALAGADDAEKERVIKAEKSGQNRKGIVEA